MCLRFFALTFCRRVFSCAPKVHLEHHTCTISASCFQITDMDIDMERDQVSISVNDYDTATGCDSDDGESPPAESSAQSMDFTASGMVRLEEDDGRSNEYAVIKRNFVNGMRSLGEDVNLVAVHKNPYSSVAGKAKLEAFRAFTRATAEKRGGDANVKFGWYGGRRDEIRDIVVHGFGRLDKDSPYGFGIHLSPAALPAPSALKAEEDGAGVRHMLLCRVILGNTETICPGSHQSQPTSIHFDSGVDSPLAPTMYIIWSTYMNSHIFPNYIVSFTSPSLIAKEVSSSSMKFSILLNVLSRFLDPSKMSLIRNYYKDFRENKIGRSQLITRLRSLVGDNILISVIKLCKNELLSQRRTLQLRPAKGGSPLWACLVLFTKDMCSELVEVMYFGLFPLGGKDGCC
ncbi:probable inactive poly [ADP-ribose] polymerase SRO2 isoform X3 [Andrographis paniculata]|uniref:probable inactive poly [ADP-ribose] polymerase SRO2 isoform X3 n=1 Tax=Andrographis paniculata TaxID=175694 RepID=UPI0021E86DE9|nr:probable inactive poly [ADP-ribose] polymerase SRO2 isoform X3 [Andrographis paniculata]